MDFLKFEQWVLKEFGINLSAYKPNQLHRRINSLMSRVGVSDLDAYMMLLKKDPVQRQKFLDFITINVTEFFRNPEIFEDLSKKIQEELLPNNKNLKVWSAACSIGAEPYSLGIILNEIAPTGKHSILATDIDTTILGKAKLGEYTDNDIKNVKKEYLDKYFTKEGDKYLIDDKIKRMVNFEKHDLILDKYDNNFDLIVCRNVVIYFNQDIKNEIYQRFSSSLKKGGLLFVGATESIYNYKDFGFAKASTFIYKKL
ncbi:MAG: protein-glutamate O-methyltransferase CheR [Clostridiales bacterium]|uniref:CheR family methyltransferase n=1 Tax=Clostridium sp. N3C TaxID=1776758 RepID=UPI00092E020D|nr:protein-glutamate O-methyltransferase CheR [Clostridium sp. N3C]NLZ49058.1 protein-glutamate O-methyltransferase CheR [Clostridiales bacterium]SCN21273.1 Chemotaxis protein methyltransferase [Clostridium sp. N3C]